MAAAPRTSTVYSATPTGVQITVVQTGRIRGPNLIDPQLKAIGEKMVAEQKARWGKHVNAAGQPALKLSTRYAIIKQAFLHKRPYRDMSLTGRTIANFTLRKAANGVIRAENTTRLERSKAVRANGYDQMIGFAVSDAQVVFDETQMQFGQWVNTAWIPLQGNRAPTTGLTGGSSYSPGRTAAPSPVQSFTSRRPSTLNRP
jgi:hypothetical protein